MSIEAIASVVVLGLALVPLVRSLLHARSTALRIGAVALWLSAAAGMGWAAVRYQPTVVLESEVTDRPIAVARDGYVSSDTCEACHPSNYASWHGSYHRRMTQVAGPETVIGRFDGVELQADRETYRLERRGDEFWAVVLDERTAKSDSPGVSRRIVMTTGSHHMQAYWLQSGTGRELSLLPFIYLREGERWIPRSAAFLKPPSDPEYWGHETGRWNTMCINCHTTHGQMSVTGREEDRDSRVAEFGISCQACHGPAERHVRTNRDPKRRYAYHMGQGSDPTAVEPADLSPRLASQVCGQCHSVTGSLLSADFGRADLLARGSRYRPGDELSETRYIARPNDPRADDLLPLLAGSSTFWDDLFWSDATVRVSGREYNGLIESPCYRGGDFSCLSCHTLHRRDEDPRPMEEWADDQLGHDMDGDRACVQCHVEYDSDEKVSAHTHHEAGSSGSLCYNCHMSYTTYGLLKAIRSHRIDSPRVQATLETGRPNACNQCHLNRTLEWTADYLERWYQTPRPELGAEERRTAASVVGLLCGDAGQRALAAWSMGWEPARQISGREWLAPYLAHLLADPYDAVRFIAYRSLRRIDGFAEFPYDFVGPPEERREARQRAFDLWSNQARFASWEDSTAVLVDPPGVLRTREFEQLALRRDDRRVMLRE